MNKPHQKRILVAGAGIAGLTAALAFAHKGFAVSVFDKASTLLEVGAGLQLAPNATRLLADYGVLEHLRTMAVVPDALLLKDGRTARTLMRMELRQTAQKRWNAPYLVCHRADLQSALVAACQHHSQIALHLGSEVVAHSSHADGVDITVTDHQQQCSQTLTGNLLIGCDGVWSRQRAANHGNNAARFSGHIAWRATIERKNTPASFLKALGEPQAVSAWLGSGVHFIAYPVKGGEFFNFVAITKGVDPGRSWSSSGDVSQLGHAFSGWHPALLDVIKNADQWTYWPLFQMDQTHFIEDRHTVLLGDAAHAMTPFAAQGAAMAIEDAAALANALDPKNDSDWFAALQHFDTIRQRRIKAVAKRGALNRFAYHATGPLALGRNVLFRVRSAEKFMADLDWLYAYDAVAALR